jgi:peptidoglycan/xylan/chitin deacetylase (PgdA/CDA1 family)/tetratricopeptide (TPR) repeat protein
LKFVTQSRFVTQARLVVSEKLCRIPFSRLCFAIWLMASSLPAFALPVGSTSDVGRQADEIVAGYRKIIVLTSDDAALDDITRDRVTTLGRILFQQNEERLEALSAGLSSDTGALTAFLDRLEKSSEYHDADKLVFRDLLDDLSAGLPQDGDGNAALRKRMAEDIAALDQIQALYQKELAKVFDRFRTRGLPVRREAWEKYLAFLMQKYQREQILKEYESALPPNEGRGAGSGKKKNTGELFGTELPPKTLLLTFDDGPHPRYTDAILEILRKYQIQAVFFQVGRNLGSVAADGSVKLAPGAAIDARILQSGSAIGNHSYTHTLLPKLDVSGYSNEINSTNLILKNILKADPMLFRPPYGARNDGILQVVQAQKLKSMIWNIDSLDWADPVPNSVADRVLKEVDHEGRGIILFHDIHQRAVKVLPQLIETLQSQGYRFAAWNGNGFSVNDSRGVQNVAIAKPAEPAYRESWAAIIGIDDYQKWPKLRYAANDATAMRDILVQKYQFKPQNVFLLLNGQATRENILSLIGDKLANPDMVKREDRVFVFYAGHGATRKLPSGRDLGYIIPVDADLQNYQGKAISMTNFQDIAEAVPAKHLLFVMDSCYSGLALVRGGGIAHSTNYLQEITRRTAREMFTAGGADEQVADNGPNGHSIFTWTLLQALDGRADLNGDGVITGTELAAYVAPAVSSLSHQTPAFGNMPGSEGGDFIFSLPHESEFLNADSTQLGEDAIRLNSEVERLRTQNEALQRQLDAAKAQLQNRGEAQEQPATAKTALTLNDEGLRLYKEKRYDEALDKFSKAAALDPSDAESANNAGFVLFRMQRYEDAIVWFRKTVALDPNRAVAYVNLGDAYLSLNRKDEAGKAYEKYLELAPTGRSAAYAKQKMRELGQQ